MHAIIKTGGKQYRVEKDEVIFIEKLNVEAGETVTFDEVVMVGDKVGTPFVEGAKVEAEVVKQTKGKKIRIFKFTAKKDFRKRKGHRQNFTVVKITNIVA